MIVDQNFSMDDLHFRDQLFHEVQRGAPGG